MHLVLLGFGCWTYFIVVAFAIRHSRCNVCPSRTMTKKQKKKKKQREKRTDILHYQTDFDETKSLLNRNASASHPSVKRRLSPPPSNFLRSLDQKLTAVHRYGCFDYYYVYLVYFVSPFSWPWIFFGFFMFSLLSDNNKAFRQSSGRRRQNETELGLGLKPYVPGSTLS